MFFKNQKVGKYEILDTIGTGGFGCVYLARDALIDKKVAIKVPHKQSDNFEKLLREPRLLAALNHPNIVSVITAEEKDDVFYIVMEYVDGISLERHLRKVKQLPLEQALHWFIIIGRALAYAHSKQILHRDVRPANILISKDGQVKMADLGTSRYLKEGPFASTRIGSPPYMAPEHFQGKATYQSDLYSFGVLMYECLVGALPFFDKNPRRLAQIAREGKFEPPHRLNQQVPLELSHIICKAMHRNLEARYKTADEIVEALIAVKHHEEQDSGQVLAHLVESEKKMPKRHVLPQNDIPTREFTELFCWNCNRPVQRRTHACPHCGELLH